MHDAICGESRGGVNPSGGWQKAGGTGSIRLLRVDAPEPSWSSTIARPPARARRGWPLRALWGAWRAVRFAVSWAVLAALAALVTAHVVQDRVWWMAYAAFCPLWMIGVPAVAWDLLRRGRSLPLRWLLLCLGLATTLLGVSATWGPRLAPEPFGEDWGEVRVLQWNTQWGGLGGQTTLRAAVGEIQRRGVDVALLSEMPPPQWFWHEWKQSSTGGLDWLTTVGMGPGGTHWFRFGLISRWPAIKREEWALPGGWAALFEIDVPRESGAPPMRLLAVDVESSPRVHRAPALRRAGEVVEALFRRGTPVDVIAGDFNAPYRAWGFEAVTGAGSGYRRAALWSGQRRATWPTRFPLIDIDHVLVRRGIAIQGAEVFSSRASDHLGQTATLRAAAWRR